MGRSAKIRHRRLRRLHRGRVKVTARTLRETMRWMLDSIVVKDDGLYAQAGFKDFIFIQYNG